MGQLGAKGKSVSAQRPAGRDRGGILRDPAGKRRPGATATGERTVMRVPCRRAQERGRPGKMTSEGDVVMAERTPLYDVEERAGATFAEEAGWLMPAHYGDALAEYRAALDGAAVFDVSHRGKIEARGPDAATFLQNLCTNEIKNLAPGSGCEA